MLRLFPATRWCVLLFFVPRAAYSKWSQYLLVSIFCSMLLLKHDTQRGQSCNGPVVSSLKCSTCHHVLICRIISSTAFFHLVCCSPMTVKSVQTNIARTIRMSNGTTFEMPYYFLEILEDLNSTKNSPVNYVRKWKSLTEVAECGQLPDASVLALFGQNLEPFVFY